MKTVYLILGIVVMILISCSPKLSPDQDWGNQRWVLTELKEVPVQLSSTRKDAFIRFSPADKRFTGNAGCNRISGNYILEKKNRIRLGEVISTKMSCDDINFETAFLSTLSQVNRYETSGNILLFKKDGKVVLKFRKEPQN